MKNKTLIKKLEKLNDLDIIFHADTSELNMYFNISEIKIDGKLIQLIGKTKTLKRIQSKIEVSKSIKEWNEDPITRIIYKFLKRNKLGISGRGYSSIDLLKEISCSIVQIRESLFSLQKEGKIVSTGETKHIKFCIFELREIAENNWIKEKENRRKEWEVYQMQKEKIQNV